MTLTDLRGADLKLETGLDIVGTLAGQFVNVTLQTFASKQGNASWLINHCGSVGGYGGDAEWKLADGRIDLGELGSLTPAPPDPEGIINWKGNLTLNGEAGSFDGQSSTTPGISVAFGKRCPDEDIPATGAIIAFAKPELRSEIIKFFRSEDWIISKRPAIGAPMSAKNAFLILVPVGSEEDAIKKIQKSGLAYDAARELMGLTTPGLGWITLPNETLNSKAPVSQLLQELQTLLEKTWAANTPSIAIRPRSGNAFAVEIRGPLSKFVESPRLPGHWIEAKLDLLVDHFENENRLLVLMRDAKLITWPENGRGTPPSGYGTRLQCEEEGNLRGMASAIAVESRILDSALKLYGGRDIAEPMC